MSPRILSLVAVLLLGGCDGGGGSGAPPAATPTPAPPPVVEVNGAVQKGPFLVGSTVLINLLDELGRSTPSTIVAEIEDSIGSFSFVTSQPGLAQLVASGYYFSELTGQISSGPITLRALYAISDKQGQVAYVNILTHLIHDRVLKLISAGNVTLTDAIAQAESELLEAFSSAMPVSGIGTFSGLNIYSTSGGSSLGDVYLLALSAAFYKYSSDKAKEFGTATDAELTLIVNQLSDDLEDDGRIQTPNFMTDFIRAVRMLSPETIISNLQSRGLVDYPRGLSVPDISVFLGLCAGDLECPWRAGAPKPLPYGVATAYDGKVYVFGTMYVVSPAVDGVLRRHSFEYDPAKNEWRQIASMPVDLPVLAVVIGDKIYVVVGYGNQLLEYTPATDQWRQLAPRPSNTPPYAFMGAAVGGKIYLIGGDLPGPTQFSGPVFNDALDIYDPVTNTWSRGRAAPMPVSIWSRNACVYDGEMYVFGGTTVVGAPPETFVWSYNPSQDLWSAKTPMTASRQYFACVEVGGEIYLLGGHDSNNRAIDVVERFNPLQQTWSSPTRLPTNRAGLSAVAIGSRIFLTAGIATQPDYIEILDTEAL